MMGVKDLDGWVVVGECGKDEVRERVCEVRRGVECVSERGGEGGTALNKVRSVQMASI